MPRKRPPRKTPNSQQETTSPSPPPPPEQPAEQDTNPSPSSSSEPMPLPLNWTDAEWFIFSCRMYMNNGDFDDSQTWWGKIAPYFPNKTVQELRLFSYLIMQNYNQLAPARGWIEVDQPIKNLTLKALNKMGLPSDQDVETLLSLVEKNPSILTEKGGWEKLAGHFPGKNARDIGRNISMVQLTAIYMGALNALLLKKSLRAAKPAEGEGVGVVEVCDDDEICVREPIREGEEDSAPSTSGRPAHSEAWETTSKKGHVIVKFFKKK